MLASIITILIFLVCLLLMLVVLIQNPKGGGLATGFSGSNQMMGVRRTTDFLEKATWTLAALLLVLSVASTSNLGKDAPTGPSAGTSVSISKAGDFSKPLSGFQSPVAPQNQPGAQPGAQPATPTAPPAAPAGGAQPAPGQKTP